MTISAPVVSAKRDNLPSLTGIRGVGAVWVLIFHLKDLIQFLFGINLDGNPLFNSGYFGVDLFFILSGFIMSHIHYDDFKNGVAPKFKYFMMLRIFRIYPLHMTVMFALLFIVMAFPDFAAFQSDYVKHPDAYAMKYFPVTLFLVQNWGVWFGFPWNGLSWTISVEMLIYIIFPFLVLGLRHVATSPARNLFFGLAPLILFGIAMQASGLIDKNSANIVGFLRGLIGFSAGCFLNLFFKNAKPVLNWSLICGIALALILLAIGVHALRWAIYGGFGLLILSLAYKPAVFEPVFGRGIILWLGKISFALYLTHLILLYLALWQMNVHHADTYDRATKTAMIAAITAICLLTAQLCHYGVELPARKLGRMIARLPIMAMPKVAHSSGQRGNT